MKMEKRNEGDVLVCILSGRIDAETAPELENDLNTSLTGVSKLELDFADVEYISSAGLRVLLNAQKRMKTQGGMMIRNIRDSVMEVFEMTGFSAILMIEK